MKKQKKVISNRFESVTAFAAWLDNNKPCGHFEGGYEVSKEESDDRTKFCGTSNYSEANNLLLGGWHDGAARVAAYMCGGIRGRVDQAQNYYSPVGFAPSVGRYLAGHPCNMINRRKVSVPSPVVDIVYNCSVDWSVKANKIEQTAAKLFNVIAGLERSGVRVNLWVVHVAEQTNEISSLAVKIKTAGQPFNLLKMVYPCVHPSFLRRQVFAYIERAGLTDNWNNYGLVILDAKKVSESVAASGVHSNNIFDYYSLKDKSEKEIKDMIK